MVDSEKLALQKELEQFCREKEKIRINDISKHINQIEHVLKVNREKD